MGLSGGRRLLSWIVSFRPDRVQFQRIPGNVGHFKPPDHPQDSPLLPLAPLVPGPRSLYDAHSDPRGAVRACYSS